MGDGVNQKLIVVLKCVDDKEKPVGVYFLKQEHDKMYICEKRGRDVKHGTLEINFSCTPSLYENQQSVGTF